MKSIRLLLAISVLVLAGARPTLLAQAANDNRTGPAGIFNGNISTAGSYDPYTANVTRSITDIAVAGAVGTQPLALVRTYNSRGGLRWTTNYEGYHIDDSDESLSSLPPASYSISFPDGRFETFSYASGDTYFRAASGVRERFIPVNQTTGLGYLVLLDGSKIEFTGTRRTLYDGELHITTYIWSYKEKAVIDPFGMRTALTYDTGGYLTKVTEPAGRYLQFTYITTIWGDKVLDKVTASDGRIVQYHYSHGAFSPGTTAYTYLDTVTYYGDSNLVAHYTYTAPNVPDLPGGITYNGQPLLATCDDVMYGGAMRQIAYAYATQNNPNGTAPVYGQILSEKNFSTGQAVSTLTINTATTRTETRGDGKTRTFTYGNADLVSATDFKGISSSQTHDSNNFIDSVTDANAHTTNYTYNTLTGSVSQITLPLTPNDTPANTPRGTIRYTYNTGSEPYFLATAIDEAGNTTTYTRDTSHRVTRVDYPDATYETFVYNSFNEVTSHRLRTGGTETLTYDARGLRTQARDPYHATGNPNAWYQYDSLDRLTGVTDTLGSAAGDVNHTTNYAYNNRGQVITTTLPTDPIDSVRHTIVNAYNITTGTLTSTTDQLGHTTIYTYDDYRRARTVTTPLRFTGDTTPRTSSVFYDATGVTEDYRLTSANVTFAQSPSGKLLRTVYDDNLRKISVTAAYNTTDAATTTYGYDNVGNVTSVKSPNEQPGQSYSSLTAATTVYDERNRPMSATDGLGNATSFAYDAYGRKKSVTRSNGQVTTIDAYDVMNRVTQQTVKQTPDPDATTKYTYNTAGLLATMQDPRLVANSSAYSYSYSYDLMGRKTGAIYPPDSAGVQKTEAWVYDIAGRAQTFTNRAGNIQTFGYDAVSRPTGFNWNDGGATPGVSLTYDVGNRPIMITNADATITRTYFNDNLLNTETTRYADVTDRTVTYTYNADGNRATIQYPNGAHQYNYSYSNRSQLSSIIDNANSATVASYTYDVNGNLAGRALGNSTSSSYTYDALSRVTHMAHALAGGDNRSFDYGYDNVSNRSWTKRDGGLGDVFGYDKADQVTATQLNIANPDTTAPGATAGVLINYDANGNRATWTDNSVATSYTTNNLNQYSSRTNGTAAVHDANGNMTNGLDGSTYAYDAQNRVRTASKAGTTDTFKYDGMNRQVSRKTGSASPTYNVYDGWDLIEEYNGGSTSPTNAYVYGATGVTKGISSMLTWFYYQDGSGSTSHIANSSGQALESYRYDVHGTPIVYDAAGVLRTGGSAYGIRHLFTGQQWYSEVGLYDLRNRFYSPDIGRFVQADPSGFAGDATNLYRYCGNNPLTHADPSGLNAQRAATIMRAISIGRPTAVDAGGGDVDSGGGGLTQGVAWDVSGIQGFDMSYLGGVGQLQFEQGLMGFGPANAWSINAAGVVQNLGPVEAHHSSGSILAGGQPVSIGITSATTTRDGQVVLTIVTVGSGGKGFIDVHSAAMNALSVAVPAAGALNVEVSGLIFANSDYSYGWSAQWSPSNTNVISYYSTALTPVGTTVQGLWSAQPGNAGPHQTWDTSRGYFLYTGTHDGNVFYTPGGGARSTVIDHLPPPPPPGG